MAENKRQEQLGERSPSTAGADQVQKQVDTENAQGYSGEQVDPTPDEVYALPDAGLKPSPAPEVDPATRAEVNAEVQRRARASSEERHTKR